MPVDINGTTGIESPGYSQGGTPIVESGSNSDGHWTRWADGLQFVISKVAANLTTSGNQNPLGAHPREFLTTGLGPMAGGFQLPSDAGLSISERDSLKNAFACVRAQGSSGGAGGWLFSCDGTGGNAAKELEFWAFGRWK